MVNLSRKSFLASLFSAATALSVGAVAKSEFKDIDPNLHYLCKRIHLSMDGKHIIDSWVSLYYDQYHTISKMIEKPDVDSIELEEIETGTTILVNHSWLREFYSRHTSSPQGKHNGNSNITIPVFS